ncbi:MAG: hypothetical protein F6K41_03985 [Symploca sp. SIO3E6]|nr:hypothetical protein [Caldora sp. SIO3E6]
MYRQSAIANLLVLLFPISDSRFPIPNAQFPIPNSRFPMPNSQFPKALSHT